MQLLDLHQDEVLESHSQTDEFRLLQGQESLSDYQFGSYTIHHLFCSHCGVKPFGRGPLETLGGDFYAVNVACLDNATPEELVEARVGAVRRW